MSSSTVPLIIDNQDVQTASAFEVRNPRTGALVHHASSASVIEAEKAVKSAQSAFVSWSKSKPAVRRAVLLRVAELLEHRREELLGYVIEETSVERQFADFGITAGINLVTDVAGKVSGINGYSPMLAGDATAIVYKEPYGVMLGIAPWNAPFILGVRKAALAVAAGNTMILKGAELAPKSYWAIGDVFRQAGLPAGCVNVLVHCTKDAAKVTTALIAAPEIQKICFTGSTAVGRIIAATAGENLKPVVLELGGKGSCIVLDDANLEKAAVACTLGAFMHAGQVCMSTERIIVHRNVIADFRTALRSFINAIYGDDKPAPALISPVPVEKNKSLVKDAVAKGATILTGTLDAPVDSKTGMRPIVVEGVTVSMDMYYSESFGPTVSLFVVDSDSEALQLANDTDYGLSTSIFTENLGRGLSIARELDTGAVHINSMTIHDEPVLPHGGVKSSGYGRFGGADGLDEFLKTKSVTWMN
ncbi:aldehyde dehydrogenase [Aspergillus uvarum CBS 121591]|uniref:Aldehyde dehydrogenase n=1 Tax=Aspergillus uvarum CBS 121591 TaxID=1448315 RepID=A0A319BZP6_9EURO|nr:aldehyde dehydrogenase [Aspergillus uvarum CBS 121591]PYH76969.1 aldehyde dehydrogenase [Aspergillus uvarum CBS 121591]